MNYSVEIIAFVLAGVISLVGVCIFRLRQENRRLKEEYRVKIEIEQYWRHLHEARQQRFEKHIEEQHQFILDCQWQIRTRNKTIQKLQDQLSSIQQLHNN